jgi:hypothetical protein
VYGWGKGGGGAVASRRSSLCGWSAWGDGAMGHRVRVRVWALQKSKQKSLPTLPHTAMSDQGGPTVPAVPPPTPAATVCPNTKSLLAPMLLACTPLTTAPWPCGASPLSPPPTLNNLREILAALFPTGFKQALYFLNRIHQHQIVVGMSTPLDSHFLNCAPMAPQVRSGLGKADAQYVAVADAMTQWVAVWRQLSA